MRVTKDVVFAQRMSTAHPFNINWIGESQCEGGRPHGSPIPEGASTIKLVPGRLVHITELRGGQLFQHLDHSRTITTTWGRTVLLSKPRGVRHQGSSICVLCVSASLNSNSANKNISDSS